VKAIIEPHPWLPYVAPFALFVGLTGMQPYVPGGVAWIYPAKMVLTGLLILAVRRWLVPSGDWAAVTAAVTGLIVLVLWILPEGLYPLLGQTTIFDPYQHFSRPHAIVWIGFRLVGAVLVVPMAKEFFWRGFLIRWLVRSDFQNGRCRR
jgi:CAAX prenyl protease-like protein